MAFSFSEEQTLVMGERTGPPRPIKSRPQDRFGSITDNPFYKNYGRRQPRSPRDVPSFVSGDKPSESDNKSGLREELGEYKPGSGFVHKLMGKFASMEVRDPPPSTYHIKHAASVDDLEEPAPDPATQHRDRRVLNTSAQHRARSVESLGRWKSPPSKPIHFNLRHIERKWEHPKSTVKLSRESHHIVAPDVDLARDDIILIENPRPEPPPEEEEGEGDRSGSGVTGFKDEVLTAELPKPNTVSTVRIMFESGLPLSPISAIAEPFSAQSISDTASNSRDSDLSPREISSAPRDSFSTKQPVAPLLDSSSRDAVLAAILRETPRPVVHPSSRFSGDVTQRHDASRSRFSSTSDYGKGGSFDLPSSPHSTSPQAPPPDFPPPPLPASILASVSTVTSNAEAKDSECQLSENSKPLLAPLPSPRSTATVKAIPANNPAIPTRSQRPINTTVPIVTVPPSYTSNLKKTSPVMPVAPFKETKADEEDENRHLIFTKKDVGSKPKPIRVRDYSEVKTTDSGVDAFMGELNNEEGKGVLNDFKFDTENKNNRTHAKGRAPPIPRRPSDENLLDSTKIEKQWRDLLKPSSHKMEEAKPVTVVTMTESVKAEDPKLEPGKESSRPDKPPRLIPSKTDHRQAHELEQLNKLLTSATKKDEKVLELDPSKSSTPVVPALDSGIYEDEDKKEDKTKESDMNGADTDEPVRGIPSIIAKRLQQNGPGASNDSTERTPPGELFGVRLGKTRHTDDMTVEIPAKRFSPASDRSSTNNDATSASSNLPEEIENQIASVRNRMHLEKIKKQGGVSQIFDSSQLQKKKREKQAGTSNSQVPRLDLSSITVPDSDSSQGSFRVTGQEIKPCPIHFIGAGISTGRSMLNKNRKFKVSIQFHEVLVETFEYPSEETMLEDYMKDHPDELLTLEEVYNPGESSDDSEIPETPRGGNNSLPTHEGELLRSNTSLAHTGNLQSYRGRFVQDYQLGAVQLDTLPDKAESPQSGDCESIQLQPDQAWSEEATSDLLF